MSPIEQGQHSRPAFHEVMRADLSAAASPPGLTVWIARSAGALAFDIAERLRGLNADVRFREDCDAADPRAAASAVPVWRGGLAPGVLRRIREHIEQELVRRIEIRELAAVARLSKCHFSRAFLHSVGVSPQRYVMTRRIAVAAALVKETDRSLTDIALSVGFSDQSHFSRAFGRIQGETPGAFRRRHR